MAVGPHSAAPGADGSPQDSSTDPRSLPWRLHFRGGINTRLSRSCDHQADVFNEPVALEVGNDKIFTVRVISAYFPFDMSDPHGKVQIACLTYINTSPLSKF